MAAWQASFARAGTGVPVDRTANATPAELWKPQRIDIAPPYTFGRPGC